MSSAAMEERSAPRGRWLQPSQRAGKKFVNPIPTAVGDWRMMFKLLPQLFKDRKARSPRVTPGPFRTDGRVFAEEPRSGLRVTWFGHSAMLVEIDGVRVLIDPVWEPRASPSAWLGPKRFFPPTMALSEMPAIDVVLLSHDHYDHLGGKTVWRLARLAQTKSAMWVTSTNVGALLTRWGVQRSQVRELNWMERTSVRSERTGRAVEIVSAPARHFSGRSLWNRYETLWSSFVLLGEAHRVYFGADSGLWPGFGELAAEFGPFDLTMLEIGAFNELWKDIHMGPDGAAEAFLAMGGHGLLMPIHWGLFDLALHAWRQPIERLLEVARERGITLWSPEPGRPTEVVSGEGFLSDWWMPGRVGG